MSVWLPSTFTVTSWCVAIVVTSSYKLARTRSGEKKKNKFKKTHPCTNHIGYLKRIGASLCRCALRVTWSSLRFRHLRSDYFNKLNCSIIIGNFGFDFLQNPNEKSRLCQVLTNSNKWNRKQTETRKFVKLKKVLQITELDLFLCSYSKFSNF